MDYFNEIATSAFEDELEKIAASDMEKMSGLGDFLVKGIKGWQWAGRGAARAAEGVGRRTWSSHPGLIKKIYQKGAKKDGWIGGIRNVAKSRYGAMGGTAGLGALAAYGGYKASPLSRNDRQ